MNTLKTTNKLNSFGIDRRRQYHSFTSVTVWKTGNLDETPNHGYHWYRQVLDHFLQDRKGKRFWLRSSRQGKLTDKLKVVISGWKVGRRGRTFYLPYIAHRTKATIARRSFSIGSSYLAKQSQPWGWSRRNSIIWAFPTAFDKALQLWIFCWSFSRTQLALLDP